VNGMYVCTNKGVGMLCTRNVCIKYKLHSKTSKSGNVADVIEGKGTVTQCVMAGSHVLIYEVRAPAVGTLIAQQ
jgi:hypothetical protein